MIKKENAVIHPPARDPAAVLFDFGGVLTTSVLDAFAAFSEEISGDPQLLFDLLTEDDSVARAFIDHEEGRVAAEDFEGALAAGFSSRGVSVPAHGLIAGMQRRLRPDRDMLELVDRVRSLGFGVGLVSNSLGRDCYAGFDLDALFDVQAISGHEGTRKPSKRLYRIACERLGVDVSQAIMIDDLRQNIEAAAGLGMGGIVHSSAAETIRALGSLLDRDLDAAAPRSTT